MLTLSVEFVKKYEKFEFLKRTRTNLFGSFEVDENIFKRQKKVVIKSDFGTRRDWTINCVEPLVRLVYSYCFRQLCSRSWDLEKLSWICEPSLNRLEPDQSDLKCSPDWRTGCGSEESLLRILILIDERTPIDPFIANINGQNIEFKYARLFKFP